jgi:hypothetical protein
MRRLHIILISSLAALVALAFAATALAVSPHYISAASGLSESSLTANFKIAGLGDNQTITVTLTADATAQYACINGGGNHPKATNKETVSGPVSASGDFTSGKNGNVTGTLTAPPPDKGDFSCPSGQKLVLTFAQYTNVQLSSVAGTIDLADQTFGAPV